ncbi:MAG TPA: hemolysin family protein [Verrucomicrobiae bacterium]|jgi:CBS domain containing-hemolysin-like protein
MLTPTLALVAMVVFAGASFFFALAETALSSLGKWQVRQLVERDPGRGRIVEQLLAQPQDVLATIVLGNTVANTALVTLALWMVFHANWPIAWTLAGTLVLMIVGCEVAPKTLAVRVPDLWAVRVAPPMRTLLMFSKPLRHVAQAFNSMLLSVAIPASVKPLTGLNDQDYRELLDLAHQHGALGQTEKEIILQIVSLDERTVREVMTPRARMACIPDDLSIDDMIAAARRFKHRRLPMYDETPDTIVGVLDTRALLLDPHIDLADAIEFPSFVPETMNLLQLLKSLQRQGRGMAVVMDEYGGTAGVVTLEDILGVVLGRARRESETQGFVMEKLGAGRWRVSGTMRLDDFRREYPALGEVDEVDTMGGLMVAQLECVPAPGQSVNFRGLKLTAQQADERRVRELLVETTDRKGGV